MKEIRKKIIKIVSIVLAAAMIGTSSGLLAFAAQNSNDDNTTSSSVSDSASTSSEKKHSDTDGKEETVYIIANADGTTKKVIVSDWLKNGSQNASIEDETTLKDIKNVKGDETFTNNGENYTWAANGSDIYYQGTTDKALPVDMKITYTLDGKTVTPDEIKGKSGKVTIRFDYTNNEKRTVKVDGKSMDMYVPFLMVTGTVLDNEKFTNIEVTNGKLVNDGDRSAVLGFALPGMQENLDLDKDDYEIPSYVEISADVKDFELLTCMTVGTAELFNEVDTDKISMDDIDGTIKEFTDAVDQLSDGSSQLYDGLVTLFEKSGELADGTKQLADGAGTLYDGTGTLVSGVNDLKDGADALNTGAVQLKDGTVALVAGIKDLKSGADALDSGAGQLKDGTGTLVSGVKDLKSGADALNTGAGQLKDGTSALVSGAKDLISGADQLNSGASSLDSGASQVESGAGQVSAGASQLNAGLGQLSSNSEQLNAGAKQVFDTLLSTAETQIKAAGLTVPTLTIKNYKTELNKLVASLDKDKVYQQAYDTALETVTAEVEKNNDAITAGVTQAVQAKVLEGVLKAAGYNMTAEQYNAAVDAGQIPEAVQAQITAAVSAQMETDAIKKQISDNVAAQKKQLIEQNMNSADVQKKINEAVAKAQAGQTTIKNLITQLDSYNQFYTGLTQYTAGVDSAYDGSKTLTAGASQLYSGTKDLHSGATQLKNGTEQLTSGGSTLISGVNQLDKGASDLKNGTASLVTGVGTLQSGASDLNKGASDLKDGTASLVSGVGTLYDGAAQLDKGTGDLKDGTASLVAGVGTLHSGALQIHEGAGDLKDGADQLNDGVATLIDGVKQLRDGAKELNDGMDEFNEKAVKKIVDAVDGDIAGLIDKLKATVAAGKDYDTFGGKSDKTEGTVKFIYRTESISADDE